MLLVVTPLRRTFVVCIAVLLSLALVAELAPPAWAQESEAEVVAEVPLEPLVRPDAMSALITARQLEQRVEVSSATTETSKTFVNPDVTVTEEHHSGPVRVFDPELGLEGAWRAVDTRLVRDEDGLHPRVAAAEVAFSDGGAGPVVELFDSEGRGLKLDRTGMSLPEPEISGSVATYRQIQPGVDLELEALPAGYAKRVCSPPPASRRSRPGGRACCRPTPPVTTATCNRP